MTEDEQNELNELRSMKARLDDRRQWLAMDYDSFNIKVVAILDDITGDA